MTSALLHPGLQQRLLIAIGNAHVAGGFPPDWEDCAAVAGVSAPARSINRAISHLAEAGLVEGIMTEDGWMSLRPTPSGLARAGIRMQRDPFDGVQPPPLAATAHRTNAERLTATADEVSEEFRAISRYAGATWLRTRDAVAPRLTAMRASMADTWHMFTTFP
jgi:hypothetical protein